ncbi:hypothetical protein D6T64_02005, partial [Cryobacterium melibiosiphilum]
IAAESLIEALHVAAKADPGTVFGPVGPSVKAVFTFPTEPETTADATDETSTTDHTGTATESSPSPDRSEIRCPNDRTSDADTDPRGEITGDSDSDGTSSGDYASDSVSQGSNNGTTRRHQAQTGAEEPGATLSAATVTDANEDPESGIGSSADPPAGSNAPDTVPLPATGSFGIPGSRATGSASSPSTESVTWGLSDGLLEGTINPAPEATIARLICISGFTPILFSNGGQPLDVGRTQRLFTNTQRAALAIRDGGCMMPNCAKPPAWTETHHLHGWAGNNGQTNIDDGILFCKPCHLRLHNDGWVVTRTDAFNGIGPEYWLIPPVKADPDQTPIRLLSKSALHLASPIRFDD